MNGILPITYFTVIVYIAVAIAYFTDSLKDIVPEPLYKFLVKHKDHIFGFYNIYIAYNLFIYIQSRDKINIKDVII